MKLPPEPFGYRVFRWRRAMGISPMDAANTPRYKMEEDLFYLEQERIYRPKNAGNEE